MSSETKRVLTISAAAILGIALVSALTMDIGLGEALFTGVVCFAALLWIFVPHR